MITTILVVILLALLIAYAVSKEGRPTNYPPVLKDIEHLDGLNPGPRWWPFIGNGFALRKLSKKLNGQHLAFSKLAKDYDTPVLGLKLGKDLVVVGVTIDAVRAILTREVFTGRPVSFFMKLRCFGKRQGITSTDGEVWKDQRAFIVRHLKQFGYGKETMECLIMDEVKELVRFLKKEKNVERFGETIAPSVLNVLWALAAGKRLEKTDPKLKRLLELLNRRSRAFDMAGGTLNQMPWLRYIAPKQTGYSLLLELNAELKNFLMETIYEQKSTYDPDKTRHVIDAFLHEQKSENRNSNFSDDELVVLLLDLFLGGAQTTSRTLDFAFLLMIKNPDVQEKVYKTIVENIGRERLPEVEDKPKLAYVEAVLLEVQRLFCVVPVIGPRRALRDTKLNGHFIPENTTVLINLYTVHHDETLFPEPYKFRPERFLNEDGDLIDQENVMTFGLGKRRCLGEVLAKSCLFQIFAGLVQNFKITKIPEDEEPSLEPVPGITIAPKPYSARFSWR